MKTVTMRKQQPEPKAITPTVTMTTAPKRRPDPLCQPQSVADAEAILSSLQAKRAELQATAAELAEAKKAAAFDAFTGGSAELVNVQRSVRAAESDIESIGHAIAEGERRLLLAKAREADLADQTNTAEILRVAAAFRTCGNELDAAARALGEKGRQLTNLLMRLHALGIKAPSFEQFDLLGHQAVLTALGATPWSKRYPPLPPLQRRTFAALVDGWMSSVESRRKPTAAEAA